MPRDSDDMQATDIFSTMAAAGGTDSNRAHAGIIFGLGLIVPHLQEYKVTKEEFLWMAELAYDIAVNATVDPDTAN